MSGISFNQANFTTGELSPHFKGRVDLENYFNGAQTIENFVVRSQGGLVRRPGTKFIKEVKTSADKCVLIPFEFSNVETYVIEIGSLYFRVYSDGGIVESAPDTPVEVVTPWALADLAGLNYTQSNDFLYISHPDYQTRIIARSAHTVWTIVLNDTLDGPYLSKNPVDDTTFAMTSTVDRGIVRSTAADFSAGDVGDFVEYKVDDVPVIAQVKIFTSSTEIIVEPLQNIVTPLSKEVTFKSYVPPVMTATHAVFHRGVVGAYMRFTDPTTSAVTWHLVSSYDGAAPDKVDVGAAITMVATTGIVTLNGRVITGTITSEKVVFVSTDVGRQFRMNFLSKQIWGEITAFTDTKVVDVKFFDPMPLDELDPTSFVNDARTDDWRLGAWSDTTGWPSFVTFHEERITFASTATEPQTAWMSQSAQVDSFAPTELDSIVLDNNGITFTIASGQSNVIEWLVSKRSLLLGDIGGEWVVGPSGPTGDPLTPSSISVQKQTSYGSSTVRPEEAGHSVLFVERGGEKIREYVYSFESDSYVSNDITVLSDHILRDGGGVVQMAYQRSPNNLLWVLLDNGELACLTFNKEQRIFAWHRHIVGGVFSTGNAVVDAITTISGNSQDELYMIVKRTIDGATKRYVEILNVDFYPTGVQDKDTMNFLDSSISYDGVAATVFTGLDHLEGETVNIVADGSDRPTQVVSSGSVTLTDEASIVHIGYNFTSKLKTMPLEGGGETGTSQGKPQRVHKVYVRLLDSLGFKHGVSDAALRQQSFRSSDGPMDKTPDLFTGIKEFFLDDSYSKESPYFIVQDQPYPLTILSIMPVFETYPE